MNSIIIDKNSSIKSSVIKNNDLEYLAKKCGFKNSKNFEVRTTWKVKIKDEAFKVMLYAKDEGRANNENKYDLPPPIDKNLYFGSIILINYDENNSISNLHEDDWEKIYEKLFGGFEDLKNTALEDDNESDELDDIADELKTKEGYLKDGFVIDDEEEYDSSVEEDSELSEEGYLYSDEC